MTYDARTFWDELLASRFDLTGVGHGGYGPHYNRFLYAAKRRSFVRALRKNGLSLEARSVLDVGCGTGFFTPLAIDQGCRSYTGLDIAPTVVRRMRAEHPKQRFELIDIGAPLTEELTALGRFDFVLCFDVIYHVVDPSRFAQAIENLWSFVAPGGHMLLVDSFWREDLFPGGSADPRPGYVPHVCFHGREHYRDLLFERSDFELVDLVPMYYLLNRPIVGARFPWTSERLNWHFRHRVFELRPLLVMMYLLDGVLVRWFRAHPNLKILIARKGTVPGAARDFRSDIDRVARANARTAEQAAKKGPGV
jgi:SAM-dependent methyltransferase